MSSVFGGEPPQDQVAAIAAGQHGVFTRLQATACGVTGDMIRRRVAGKRWMQFSRDVFRVAGTPVTWRQSLLAAILAGGNDVFASHESAAALHRLPGFKPGPIHITVPRGRRRPALPGTVIHQATLLPAFDRDTVDAIPVTAAARTLFDLAATTDIDIVEEAADAAITRGLVSLRRLRWQLDHHGRRPGSAVMRKIIEMRSSGKAAESPLETKFLRLVRKAGLPEPLLQHPVWDKGRLIARIDFAYPDRLLAIECDGFEPHAGRRAFQRDRERGNDLVALGWRIVRFTWLDITERPEGVVGRMREVLS